MKLPKLFNLKDEVVDPMVTSIKEVQTGRKRDVSLNCEARVINDVRDTLNYRAKFTEDRGLAYIKNLERLWVYPTIFTEYGKQVIYCPEKSHGEMDYRNMENLAVAQHYQTLILEWDEHMRETIQEYLPEKYFKKLTEKLDKVKTPYVVAFSTGTIDWTLFDNDLSPHLSMIATLIVNAQPMVALKDIANTKLLLALLAAFLMGGLFGFVGGTIFNFGFDLIMHYI